MDKGQGPPTLKALFAAAETRREALEGCYEATYPGYREALAPAIAGYESCLDLISQLGIFSPNESADDINTGDLPYLLTNFHIAELILKRSSTSPLERTATLAAARAAYERFLHQLDSYSLMKPEDHRLLEAYTADPTTFTTLNPTADAAARRFAKINNFRTERQLRNKLDFLRRHPRYTSGDEDSFVRDTHLAHATLATHLTFQALEGLNREAEVLAQAPVPLLPQMTSVEEDEEARRGGYTERVEPVLRRLGSAVGGRGGPILSRDGRPLQPFTMLGNRAELARGVFRPGHTLPTVTIDEFLAEERRRGGIIDGGGEASHVRPEPDEDDMEKADAETMKAREWDLFKEANPRGAGNTLNRG